MRRPRKAAWKKVLVGPELSLLNPCRDRNASGLCDLELHRSFGLALHYHRAWQYLITVGYVANMQIDKVAPAQLAIDRKIEKRKIANRVRVLKVNPDCPYVFRLQRRLLTD
jgi:hypothetical protein